ncbi:prepilin-type N-terminal cleavage/methylation domain-containing protein [Neobacillus jeddahensis]|uniref:prepilin-type N-terminal cleavage/methylation domain-containing protein n=1 Tax=Neobacillus jeddahensis TaxID=1461580 RepID=UPI00058CCE21|nr:prepilin-type N-terminal cleavage/methylation domain-containing protein [Neobacillus jeddahensis]
MIKKIGQALKNEKGLTLIELLAVIVILGIIAAIAIPSIGSIIQKSRVDAVKSDAMQIINSAKTYVSANGIPEGGTLDETELGTYIEDSQIEEYTVTITVTDEKATYTISTDKDVKAGNKDVTITNASIADLKAKTSTTVTID